MQRCLGPHLSLRLRKESLELALHLLSNRDDSSGDICLPPNFPQPGFDFRQPWRPICLSSEVETIPLSMPLLNLRGTVPFLACSLLKEGKQRSQNEWSLIFLGRFASSYKIRITVSSHSPGFLWRMGERIRQVRVTEDIIFLDF